MTNGENFNINSAIEAILFASGTPILVQKVAEALETDVATLNAVIDELIESYNSSDRGLMILRLDDSLQLCTRQQYSEHIRLALDNRRNSPLSNAAMESLAIIAYNQPVTRAYVEQIRGVDSGAVITNLVEKGLLQEVGRLDAPGRPILFGTTVDFLRCFGISSLDELPEIEKIIPEEGQVPDQQVLSIFREDSDDSEE